MRASRSILTVGAAASMVLVTFAFVLLGFNGVAAAASPATHVPTPYTVTFTETGLPSGTNWSVHIAYVGCGCNGPTRTVVSNTSTITIPVSNGTYNFHVLKVPNWYVNGLAHGTFVVNGTNVTEPNFVFSQVVAYVVQFTETGLQNGTLWTVDLNGNGTGQLRQIEDQTETTNGTTMDFMLPVGTYHYVVENVPGAFFLNHTGKGKFTVKAGNQTNVTVQFTSPPLFPVTFVEHGLVNGTNWSVRVNGFAAVKIVETQSSTTNTTTFWLPNGTYKYLVAEVLAFNVHPATTQTFAVSGNGITFNVSFVAVSPGGFYPVAFEESGLANGTSWSVTVIATQTFGHSHSEEQSSTGTTIFFLLQNGSYRFVVHGVRAYSLASGGAGTFAIAGSGPAVNLVTYAALPTWTVTFTETGLANGTNWTVLVRTQTTGSSLWPIHEVQRGATTSITFALPNGTYCYTVYAVHGYTITSGVPAGPITVAGGSPPGISLGFTPKL
jgi:hypothetical protein